MIDLFKNVFWDIIEGTFIVLLHMLKYFPGTQEAYKEEVARHNRPLLKIYLLPMSRLFFIPDHLKTQEMCNKEVDINSHFSTCPCPFKDRREVQQGSVQTSMVVEICP